MNKKTMKKLDKLKKDGVAVIGEIMEAGEENFNVDSELIKKLAGIVDEHQDLVYASFGKLNIELKED